MVGTSYARIHWQADVSALPNDRVLTLSDAKGIKTNKLHAKTEGALWYVHFEDGRLPEPLKQKWTKYSTLLKAVKEYYALKDIEITEE